MARGGTPSRAASATTWSAAPAPWAEGWPGRATARSIPPSRLVLVDMQNGNGYGGTAEGDVYVNMNQVRGSLYSNVLIGSSNGTDLKSGGDNSVLISTGGNGYELRPDGSGNVMVSTVGADRVNFDPTHGWLLGDANNIVLGFNPDHGDPGLSLLLGGNPIAELNGKICRRQLLQFLGCGLQSRDRMRRYQRLCPDCRSGRRQPRDVQCHGGCADRGHRACRSCHGPRT